MPDIRDTLNACSRLLGREAPARGPVLDLHLIAKSRALVQSSKSRHPNGWPLTNQMTATPSRRGSMTACDDWPSARLIRHMTVGSSYPGLAGVSDTPLSRGKGDAISTATVLGEEGTTPVVEGTRPKD